MAEHTAEEARAWLLDKSGLTGRSKDKDICRRNAELLCPNDPLPGALSFLDHWVTDGQVKVASTCALFAMAFMRYMGMEHTKLSRGYLGHNDCTGIVVDVASKYGAWIPDKSPNLCDPPGLCDVIRIGMTGEAAIHFVCVADYDAATGTWTIVAGGGGDGSLIHTSRVMLVLPRGIPYLVDADKPYLDEAQTRPNGRRVSGRAVLL
jgi:hypothetical protein